MKNKEKKFLDLSKIPRLKELYLPELECYIKYGPLTYAELCTVTKCKTQVDATYLILSLMLSKGDPAFTVDELQRLPVKVFLALLTGLSKAEGLKNKLKELEKGSLYS